jgi:hypothetical protein
MKPGEHASAGPQRLSTRSFPWLASDLVGGKRGSFHDRYLTPAKQRDRRANWPRLLDHIKCIAGVDDPEYFFPCAEDEFAVVDQATQEKAWFEAPVGATPDVIKSLIERHFSSCAFRILPDVWVV